MRFLCPLFAVCVFPVAALAQPTPWANKIFDSLGYDFGKVARGVTKSHTFKMTNIYEIPLQITEIRVNCGCSTATVSKKTLKPKESGELTVTVDGTKVDGPKFARIFVTVGPDFVSTATLVVKAEPELDIVMEPRILDFGTLSPGSGGSKTVQIKRPGKPEWRIVGVAERAKSSLSVKVEEKTEGKERSYQVVVALKEKLPAGAFKEEVVLKTNDAAEATLSFPVLANVEGALTVTPGLLELDGLTVGKETTRKIVVRGKSPFRITKAEGLGEGVKIDLPERSATVHILDVRVTPGRAGVFHREITIASDLGGETAQLVLDGKAEK